ncbi:chromate resistance protein ChrB domain-containing protein [Sinimarinibacterium thermocellulolyticum]|jgi:hypothetical protein|uniref:Chromate resistance protein ChrB domain-containing protein n=1 Tax=Sinimarinibacterium thermocellulolyticum TaxID=3170016 RepID=A0ABV2A980_9GAMM
MTEPLDWLLFLHTLPPKPDYLRVKVWRRLQALGAVAVKNSAYVLPSNERTREDFQWLQKEIEGLGGEASICAARFVDGLSDQQLRGLFNAARNADYAQLTEDLRELQVSADVAETEDECRTRVRKLRKRLDQIVALDFFGAEGRDSATRLLTEINDALSRRSARGTAPNAGAQQRGRTWVTRKHVGVDRMASAWLIRRFIDPAAKLLFVDRDAPVVNGQLRYDMDDGDYTHQGDRCTFEVLLDRFGLDDPALQLLGRIIHDLDLKDGKFREEETPGVSVLLKGIESGHADDDARIALSSQCFDAIYSASRSSG